MAPNSSDKVCDGDEDQIPSLFINGKKYHLGPEVTPTTTLVNFIRNHAHLPGTKSLCHEGGCGLCTVVAMETDPVEKKTKTFSLRACQTLVYSCIGWSIVTIEHLGDRRVGYDRLQNALHGYYGTQCGYCSPGFVMAMKGEMCSGESLTAEGIEKALDGNLCRCTGYRPILEAFKSFAPDAPSHLKEKLKDIEDSYEAQCQKTGKKCEGKCEKEGSVCSVGPSLPSENLTELKRGGITWHYPRTIEGIYGILNAEGGKKTRLVVGNTGQGVYKNDGPYEVYVNTRNVQTLYEYRLDPKIVIGSNVSLAKCIEIFQEAAHKVKGYRHLGEVAKHWGFVANVGVRNMGSWAGNLRMKRDHPEFSSDIFISLLGAEARLTLGGPEGELSDVDLEEFLSTDLSRRMILSVEIPPQPENVIVKEYKITPRAVNAHAYVNGSFRFHVDPDDGMRVLNRPAIVLGGINPKFTRATRTEKFLLGKCLKEESHVTEAIRILGQEVEPDALPQDASPEFRKLLAQCLLYKTVIGIVGESVSNRLRSGGPILHRPTSSSVQTFDENADTWPIGKPVQKLESQVQISGEAEYLDDIPPLNEELFGAFVQSSVAKGKIDSIDASQALKIPGVVDFISASDIPGENTFFFSHAVGKDPVFAEGEIRYYGQSVGLVVATSKEVANAAVKAVKVSYSEVTKPILTIKEAIDQNNYEKTLNFWVSTVDPVTVGDVEAGFEKSDKIVEGEFSLGGQFHFQMEPLSARVVPVEDGFDVWCTTQWPNEAQSVVSNVLNVPSNSVNISVRRIGGGYGGKITRAHIVASAAAVAAQKLGAPVRVALDLSTHMTLVGGREPYYFKYKVGFSNEGEFQSIAMDLFSDVGHVANENSSSIAAMAVPSVYYCPNWKIQGHFAFTDTPASTWCRTPGHVEAIAAIENIIERVADSVGRDPLEVRELNFSHKDKPQHFSKRKEDNLVKSSLLPLLKTKADLEDRVKAIEHFNKENRWRKRGLSVIPLRFAFDMIPFFHYNVQVVIYEGDGSVAIKHGGIEMGQGINTKVAQVAAQVLGVPLELVKIKPTDTFVGANSAVTGGSHGSDLNPHGVRVCCERIRKRMDEVSKDMVSNNGPLTWLDIVRKCFAEQVDLSERYFTFAKEHPAGYDIWGVGVTEVEVDVLTGQYLILRTDLIEDCGRSLSPLVDVGQVEGAFVMGLGFFTCEKVKFDPETGAKLSNGTWEYKIPTALDIPIDFRVSFAPGGDNPATALRSKATGEPPLCMSYSVLSALRQAIKSARNDVGNSDWFDIDVPLTVEKIHQLCKTDPSKLVF